jgi:hypothetical protein
MRLMASEPVPLLHKMGNNATMMAILVMVTGRMRSNAPSMARPGKI